MLAQHVNASGVTEGTRAFSKKRLSTVRTYQALSRALTPCFQADDGGLWRDVLFAAGLHIPGVPWLMHRSIAEPQPDAKAMPIMTRV